MGREINNKIFILTVKTPVTASLIIIVTVISLLLIALTVEVDLYFQTNGKIQFDITNNMNYIQVSLGSADLDNIKEGNKVIW